MRKDTLPHILQSQVEKYGNKRVALREKNFGVWDEITWKEYGDHVRNFSLGLISLGLERGDNVCVIGENRQEWLYADLGIQSAGGVSVGIYSIDHAEGVRYIVDHCEAKFIVAEDQEQTDKVMAFKERQPHLKKCIVMDMKGLRDYTDPFIMSFNEVKEMGERLYETSPSLFYDRLNEVQPDDVSMILYTSGTTSAPKGVMITHRIYLAWIDGLQAANPVREGDVVLSFLPLNHGIERLMSVVIPLCFGCTVNFSESTETVQENMYEIAPTLLLAVPRIYEKLCSEVKINVQDSTWLKRLAFTLAMPVGYKVTDMEMARKKVSWYWRFLYFLAYLACFRAIKDQMGFLRLRIAYTGGAAVAPEMNRFFYAVGIKLRELYGMTEIGIVATHQGKDIKIGTAGKFLPGVEWKVTQEGELLCKVKSLFAGYYKNPEATHCAKGDGWMRTNDLVYVDDEGYLHVLGRRQDVFITSDGRMIAPDEIENKLKFSPYIYEGVVVGEGMEYLIALIQIDFSNVGKWAMNNKIAYTTFKSLSLNSAVYDLIAEEIREVNRSLAHDRQIKKFNLITKELDHDEDELTATQKVRRSAIREMYRDLIRETYESGCEL